jgi:hypothetical protein
MSICHWQLYLRWEASHVVNLSLAMVFERRRTEKRLVRTGEQQCCFLISALLTKDSSSLGRSEHACSSISVRNHNRPTKLIGDLHELRGMQMTTSRERAERSQKSGLFYSNSIRFVFRHFGVFRLLPVLGFAPASPYFLAGLGSYATNRTDACLSCSG